jgi:ATPase subunit of ABC transporter with duplicated ATPase domains
MTCHDREFMNRVVSRIVEVANQTGDHLQRQL